ARPRRRSAAPAAAPGRSERDPDLAVWRSGGAGLSAAAAAVGRRAEEEADGEQHEGQPGRVVPADRADAVSQPPAAAADRPDEELDADHVRVELRAAGGCDTASARSA